ncbi:hypothetical protein BX600DRAFT_441338 [Xylariales sp. PMI_506]|nr:hypothetical protein BX600DRAFT_441338 [Xylariales sp. PMI_506]
MDNITASVLATWPTPNYIDPPTRSYVDVIVEGIFIFIVTILILLRLYTRQFIANGIAKDDILMTLAYIPTVAYTVVCFIGDFRLQWDRHIWDIEPSLLVMSLKTSFANVILFDLAVTLTKLSMAATIQRLVVASKIRWMNILMIVLAGFISVGGIVFLIIVVLPCSSETSGHGILSNSSQHCVSTSVHILVAGIINTLTELMLVLIPIWIVIDLTLPARQQITAIALFGAGFLACAAGAVRIYFTWAMSTSTNYDFIWDAWGVRLAAAFELYIGIICACLPAAKLFFTTDRMHNIVNVLNPQSWITRKSFKVHVRPQSSESTMTFTQTVTPPTPSTGPPPSPYRQSTHRKSRSADLNKPLPEIQEVRPSQRYSLPLSFAFGFGHDPSFATNSTLQKADAMNQETDIGIASSGMNGSNDVHALTSSVEEGTDNEKRVVVFLLCDDT